jgi:hypothetical protein
MVSEVHAGFSAILCADWGMESDRRAVYVADIAARTVKRATALEWSMTTVLEEAERWTPKGSVLVTFDAPLGVPETYLAAAGRVQSGWLPKTFLDLLAYNCSNPGFFDATFLAEDWTIERPFFSVPRGAGGLTSYRRVAADRFRVDLYRAIDRLTRAKTLFAKSGIPGSVGSAACALWQDLGPRLSQRRNFRVWPFEGDLDFLLRSAAVTAAVVIGEIYPRAAYATALLDIPAAVRPPLAVAKTDASVRRRAIAVLTKTGWVAELGVSLEDLEAAEANEDDFDACITAAALLRCVLEGVSLCTPPSDSACAEGGMLGTAAIDLQLPEQTFRLTRRGEIQSRPSTSSEARRMQVRSAGRTFRCPIKGCEKIYEGTRRGWDGHVGSARIHPCWRPDLTSAEARKRQFELQFPEFFG